MKSLLPPIVVLPEPLTPCKGGPAFSEIEDAAGLAGQAAGALDRLSAFGGPQLREASLCAALAPLERLESLLGGQPGSSGEEFAAKSLVQQYFRIRTADLDSAQASAQAIGILVRSLDDLRSAPLAGASTTRETAAIRQVLIDQGAPGDAASVDGSGSPGGELPEQTSQHWFSRWISAHQLHALFNVHAALAIGRAVENLHDHDVATATAHIRRATVYVNGFSAARAHALALPSWFYNDVLRPSMAPPMTSAPLSGRMHLEYKAYRSQMSRLLTEVPLDIRELAEAEPDLAFAREALLEADLLDCENHVCLVEPVVGHAKSLIQNASSRDHALSILRAIRDRRAAGIRAFVRGGRLPAAEAEER
ncbi:hypothetical protein ACIQK5_06145 [Streptomyces virginiae]|uniref:hypothetical protein n=1 Tax=Streptomyces virginiae TaxID=1961 RepID=UPI0037F41CBA